MSEANVEIGRHYEIRHGKRGKRREVGIDDRSCEHPQPGDRAHTEMPVGPPFCTIDGPLRGRPWSSAAPAPARHAVELTHEGVPLNVIQRQLGHANLGTTSISLQGIDNAEIIDTVHTRRAPITPPTTALDR
jgi:hypothetical protein